MALPIVLVTQDDDLPALFAEQIAPGHTAAFQRYSIASDVPPPAPVTVLYDFREVELDRASADVDALRLRFSQTRIVAVTDGGFNLSQAALAVRSVDDEWDLTQASPEIRSWWEPLATGSRPVLHQLKSSSGVFETYSENCRSALESAYSVASRAVPVLLSGETGAGKTTTARFLHDWSDRHTEPFLVLACGAVPGELLEAELFGHVRGAFTSAHQTRLGRLEAAGRGTLLIDEVDVLGLDQQAKLLRVVESGEFEPVGSTETRLTQCRLVFASNVDLEQLVADNRFRSDLFFRINVVDIHLPPLRERPHDIPLLAVHCLKAASQENHITTCRVNLDFLRKLQDYDWPGNIRELKNRLLRSMVLSSDGRLTTEGLGLPAKATIRMDGAHETVRPGLETEIRLTTRRTIERVLRENNNNRTAAARALGISRSTLYRKLERLDLADTSLTSNTAGQIQKPHAFRQNEEAAPECGYQTGKLLNESSGSDNGVKTVTRRRPS